MLAGRSWRSAVGFLDRRAWLCSKWFMDKSEYIAEVKKRLVWIFKASKESYKIPNMVRHRLEGFMYAGVFLGLATQAEMRALIEDTHVAVFGETVEDRKKGKSATLPDIAINYDQYDSPTVLRSSK